MNQLDLAAATRQGTGDTWEPYHQIATVQRSLRIVDSAFDLSAGDRFDGPDQCQLLIVGEQCSPADNGDRRCVAAVDAFSRDILRRDDWLIALSESRLEMIASELQVAVEAASRSVSAFPADDSSDSRPQIAFTAAMLCWPSLIVVQAGDGVAAIVSDREVQPLMHTPRNPTAEKHAERRTLINESKQPSASTTSSGLTESGRPSSNVWSGQLSEGDIVVLGTKRVTQASLEEVAKQHERHSKLSAAECAELVINAETASTVVDSGVAMVAKLSTQTGAAIAAAETDDSLPSDAEAAPASTLAIGPGPDETTI